MCENATPLKSCQHRQCASSLKKRFLCIIVAHRHFWLIDKILFTTRAKNNLQEFGAWKLEVNEDKSAILVCEDGNYHELYREKIEWTDFPLNKIELWFENGVLILPSEH
ncbi:hypothetical protein D4R78_07835 [bacterium]|nr:MAG: hypothetical protein D4R78_07835 [bacterium]